jgi:hypothetical protein
VSKTEHLKEEYRNFCSSEGKANDDMNRIFTD